MIRERGEGFVAAAFRHRTSRAQDPHLHTYVIVANLARAPDGKWRALDGEAILKTYRLAAGYLYEAELRDELTRRLGLEWTQPVKGMGELACVPEEAIRAFSMRRQSLLEHMEALGTEGFAAARVAALATREMKEQIDLPRLREGLAGPRGRAWPWTTRARSAHPLPSPCPRSRRPRPARNEAAQARRTDRKADHLHHAELVQAVAGSSRLERG